LLFNGALTVWSAVILLVVLALLPFPGRMLQSVTRLWMRSLHWLLRVTVGLTYEVRGLEGLPPGPVIFAAKHQSAWDTTIFYCLVEDPAYVLKKELLSIPIYGWYLQRTKMISIDREAGPSALRRMLRQADEALGRGRSVVIFPEGTRVAPGEKLPYHPGVAALYSRTEAAVVPVAVNSGLFWGRRSFLKRPGTIVIEMLPPMPRDLDRRGFMAELERRIEEATARLVAEAGDVLKPDERKAG
jgi:1-acyl-sn-glycerol-3-phosphate acyltransferase